MKAPICVIDLGGSTVDFVEFDREKQEVLKADFLSSDSVDKNDLVLILKKFGVLERVKKINTLILTGGHSQTFPDYLEIDGIKIDLKIIHEFEAIAKGGLFLAQKEGGLVVSMGTGTAMVLASLKSYKHVGGTGIGGGTFLGLSRAILNISDFNDLKDLSKKGDCKKVDLSIGEVIGGDLDSLPAEATASNFAKYSKELSRPEDVVLGVSKIVGQSIALLAMEKAENYDQQNIILGGKVTKLAPVVAIIKSTAKLFDKEIFVPKYAEFMTAIGAALSSSEN